ncbi:MAG: hypothetical protein IKS49_02185 [Actinomycetaceae bacterium]|nr:hypothetical protein [Actinomycetaceae bacterium]
MPSKKLAIVPNRHSKRKWRISALAFFSALTLLVGTGVPPTAYAANSTAVVTATQTCSPGNTKLMYRLYNRISGEHLYTADTRERDILARGDWNYEGVGWVAPQESSTPVYRLYNRGLGDHHYTPDANEVKMLTSKYGWKSEGIGWYSDDCHTIKVYRQYNPRLRVGAHNYTTDRREYDANNSRNGWQGEDVAWYAAEEGWQRGAEPTYVHMAVSVSDKDGLASDTFTIPATAGLQYAIGGKNIAAGTYKVKDYFSYKDYYATVTVTATAKKGYRLKGAASWTKTVDSYISATAKTVTFTDKDGSANDTFTIPNVTGVQYKVGSKNIAAGTYKVKDYFTYTDYWANPKITATPKAGYKLTGTTSWTKKIDGRVEVTTKTVTFTDKNGQASDTFVIPSATGVQYKAGTKNVAAGTFKVKNYFTYTNYMATATVTASPKAGYKFPAGATTSWKKTIDGYTYVDTAKPTSSDGYGKKSDTYTIPNVTGVQYKANGTNVTPGKHNVNMPSYNSNGTATVNITATPKAGYKINTGNQTSWSFKYTAIVKPEAVTFTDPTGTGSDTYKIPEVEGIYYTVDGVRTKPGTYKPTNYTNHFRNISIHAYAEPTYQLEAGSTVYYLHTFTDGVNETPPAISQTTKDYGPYTTAEAQTRIEAYANQLSGQIYDSSAYSSFTTFGQIYGSDSISSRTYGDAEKEINRRFAKRFEMRANELRATVGLKPMPLMRLSESDEAEMFAHAVYTQDMQVNGQGHYTDDPHLQGVMSRTRSSGTGEGFDGSWGWAECIAWNYAPANSTPEQMADKMILQYINEYKYLVNHEGVIGHLEALIYDRTRAFSAFFYVYTDGGGSNTVENFSRG